MSMARKIAVRRSGSMGDIIHSFVVTDHLAAAGFEVSFSCLPRFHRVAALNPKITISDDSAVIDISLDGAYEDHPERRTRHVYDCYSDCARQQFAGADFHNWWKFKPTLEKKPNIFPYLSANSVIICPRSSTRLEDNVTTSDTPGRTVPDSVWREVNPLVKWRCYWLGIHAPAPEGMIDLKIANLDEMISAVSSAAMIVSVDTGPAYVAEAMGIPLVMIGQSCDPKFRLSPLTTARIVYPPLDCLNCQTTPCPIDASSPPCQNVSAKQIADAVNQTIAEQ